MKEYLKYIESETSRKWLEEHNEYLHDRGKADLIVCARADIRDKLRDIKKLASESDDDFSKEVSHFEKAVSLMEGKADSIFLKIIHYYDVIYYYDEDDFYYDDFVSSVPYISFEKAVKSIFENLQEETEYDNDFDVEEYMTRSWNTIERYDLENGEYKRIAEFTVGHDGCVWEAGIEDEEFYHRDLNFMTPFFPGDIIKFDAEPFRPAIRAVVVYKFMASDTYEDCCSPFMLFYDKEGLHYRAIKHVFSGLIFSPLLRAEIYDGELSDDEQILRKVCDYIKTHENGSVEIDKILMGDDGKKKLMELLGS